MTKWKAAPESYLKGALSQLTYWLWEGGKHFFQFYDPIPFVNISHNINFLSFSAAGEANGNQSEGKYFIKESEFNVNRWHSHYQVIGGSMGIAWAGDPTQLPLGDTHKLLDASWDEDAPCFRPSGAKGQAIPGLSVSSQGIWEKFGKPWQTSIDHCLELWISVAAVNRQGLYRK